MRIDKLELTRYGVFTDYVVDFGEAGTDSDFHVIYGPNEAGKSTLRDAAIDFLYGFPQRTSYNFVHPNDALLIAATLTAANETHQLLRVKRNKLSLMTSSHQSASEEVLKAVLGDISRAGFANMFSLDEDTLEEGGEGILKSEGDLGELLFSAASGLSSLSSRLDELRLEASTFFKKPGRAYRLAEMKKRLGEIKGQIREHDVPASQYDALVKQERLQRERHANAEAERDQSTARVAELKLLLDCVDLWREYLAVSEDFAAVNDAPDLPAGWLADAERLATEGAAANTKFQEISRTIEKTTAALNAIEIDSDILLLGSRVARLTDDDTEAKFLTSKDIVGRQRELSTVTTDIDALLRRLTAQPVEDPERLLLPAATIGRIKELIEPRSGIKANAATALDEVERVEERLEQAKITLAEFADQQDLSRLAETLARQREDGDDREWQSISKRCETLEEDLRLALMALKPWEGTLTDLLTVSVHRESSLDALNEAEEENNALELELFRDAERLQDERARLLAEIEAEVTSASVIEDAEANEIRAARDAAWQDHRQVFEKTEKPKVARLQSTADVFEATIQEDDRVTRTRFVQTTEIATVRKLRVDLARCEAAIQRNEEKRLTLTNSQARTASKIAEIAASFALPDDTRVSILDTWLRDRESAILIHREFEEASADQQVLRERIDTAQDAIAALMLEAELDSDGLDWKGRVRLCEEAVASWKQEKAAREAAEKAVDEAKLEYKTRKRQQKNAQKLLDAWRTDWAESLSSCWLGANNRNTSPAQAQEILDTLSDLGVKLDKASELRARIEAMQANRDAYESEVTKLATDAGETMDSQDPLKTADALRVRLAKALEDQRRCEEKKADLADAVDRLDEVTAAKKQIETRFSEMNGAFDGEDFPSIIAGMRRSERKASLQAQLGKLVRQLTLRFGIDEISDVEALLTEKISNSDTLLAIQNEHDSLVAASGDANEHVSSLFHDWKKAETALAIIGDDATVARLEEDAKVLLLDIQSEAERFMTLSAGTILVDRALDSYVATHRSSMLDKASEAFSAITRGAFTGLAAMPGKGSEILVGLRRDGTSIIAPEMSRGARFQLYLALRIAGYREFVKHREPLPFFADDILETFDDDRSAETFALMEGMAKEGQVIYLTHHRHLCEIAKQVCKEGVTVHELPDRAVAG